MDWISVKDRLPEFGGRYLVYEIRPEHIHNCLAFNYPYPCCECNIAYYCGIVWNWHSTSNQKCSPTHWMPLPKPPKE